MNKVLIAILVLQQYVTSVHAGKSKIYKAAKSQCLEQLSNDFSLNNANNNSLNSMSTIDDQNSVVKVLVENLKDSPLKHSEENWVRLAEGKTDIDHQSVLKALVNVELVSTQNAISPPEGSLNFYKNSYNLENTTDRILLQKDVNTLIRIRKKQKAGDDPSAEKFKIKGDVYAGLKLMQALLNILNDKVLLDKLVVIAGDTTNLTQIDIEREIISQIKLITIAINKNYSSPIPEKMSLLSAAVMVFDNRLSSNSPGNSPGQTAFNLKDSDKEDLSQVEPVESAIYKKNKNISLADTFSGYSGLSQKVAFKSDVVFDYLKPKTGFGTRPGMRLFIDLNKKTAQERKKLEEAYGFNLSSYADKNNIVAIKLRINTESRTGSFGPRIFEALGFNVNRIHYAGNVNIGWQKELISEYNMRGQFGTTVQSGLFRVQTKRQKFHDPFEDIVAATLKDGTVLSAQEFKNQLLKDPSLFDSPSKSLPAKISYLLKTKFLGHQIQPTLSMIALEDVEAAKNIVEENINYGFESQVAYITVGPASIQFVDPYRNSIGPFEWDVLKESREARGLGLAFAFFNMHDTRSENTRLNYLEKPKDDAVIELRKQIGVHKTGLELMLSDLGSCLGTSEGYGKYAGEDINGFKPDFLYVDFDPITAENSVKMLRFRPNQPNNAAEAMNYDDARWMARKIAQLTEQQFQWALMASGFTAPFVRLYTEKLLARRDHMVKELDLANEFSLLRPNGADLSMNFDGTFQVQLPDGSLRNIRPSKEFAVVNGIMVHKESGLPYHPDTHQKRHF